MARLRIADIEALRAKSAPLPSTIAPSVSSDLYKSGLTNNHPDSKRWDSHFSVESRTFSGSGLRNSANSAAASTRKIISLGTGRPTADYYPWEAFVFHGSSPLLQRDETTNSIKASVPTVNTVLKGGGSYNLSNALNYGNAVGCPHLVRFLTEHIEIVHNPPYADWGVCLSSGSSSALEIALRIFCNRGDTVLCERYTYPVTVECVGMVGARTHGVDMDSEGLLPDDLDRILCTWDLSKGPKPTVLYMVPTGQNPTGVTQPLERRRAIYDIAEKHDLIIIEDDPYNFLHMGSYEKKDQTNDQDGLKPDMWTDSYLDNLVPSYLSIDRSGRVVRLDSTSKILAPGLRAGWITACAQIIDKLRCYLDVSTIAVAGPSQLMLWSLLDETWGHEGFISWLSHLAQEYRSRRDTLLEACNRYLPTGITHWVPPEYGMFLWIGVDWTRHPRLASLKLPVEDMEKRLSEIQSSIESRALENGVKVTKGSFFSFDQRHNGQLYFRLTFAAAVEQEMAEGLRLFANAIREEFSLALV